MNRSMDLHFRTGETTFEDMPKIGVVMKAQGKKRKIRMKHFERFFWFIHFLKNRYLIFSRISV